MFRVPYDSAGGLRTVARRSTSHGPGVRAAPRAEPTGRYPRAYVMGGKEGGRSRRRRRGGSSPRLHLKLFAEPAADHVACDAARPLLFLTERSSFATFSSVTLCTVPIAMSCGVIVRYRPR